MKGCPEPSESVEIGLEPNRRGHPYKIPRRTRETGRLGKHACSGVRYSRRAETPRAVIGATRGVDGERMNGTGIDKSQRRRLRWRPRRLRHGREEGAPGSGEKWRSAQGRLGGWGRGIGGFDARRTSWRAGVDATPVPPGRLAPARRATDTVASGQRCDGGERAGALPRRCFGGDDGFSVSSRPPIGQISAE